MSKDTAQTASKFPSWAAHLVVIVGFLALMFGYFYPVLEGNVINQHDIVSHKGMSKELADYRAAHDGNDALWTNSMFSGMPGYQISTVYKGNLYTKVDAILGLGLPAPVRHLFLIFVGFYFLLVVLRVNPWLAALGALMFALSSYYFIILQAGHNSKAIAIAYMSPVVAGVLLAYQGRIWLGGAVTLIAMALEVNANHLQITYYLAMIVLAVILWAKIEALKNKTFPQFLKASAILAIAAALAIAPNISRLWTTYEYTQATMRGGSELANPAAGKGGLDTEYAFRWSYGIGETFTLIVPDLYGGASGSPMKESSETYELLKKNFGKKTAEDAAKRWPTYWGDQPFTSGPVYVGIVVFFLFLLSMFNLKGTLKWYILGVSVLAILLAWGRNFMGLSEFFFNYVPMYNKFRAPSMTLVIVEFTLPLLAILGLDQLYKGEIAKEEFTANFKKAVIGTLGLLALLLVGFYLTGSFSGTDDEQGLSFLPKEVRSQFVEALISDRKGMFLGDTIRGIVLAGLAAAVVWFFYGNKLSKGLSAALLIGLVAVDMLPVNLRYLGADDFVSKKQYEGTFAKSPADEAILQDKSNYRVLNMASNTFNDATTSYWHKSVGGYHPAKLQRYQDLIEQAISPEMQAMGQAFGKPMSDSAVKATFAQFSVLNMLNTKYIIGDPKRAPIVNPMALGNAWFVSDIKVVNTPDEEIKGLKGLNTATTALVNKEFEAQAIKSTADATDKITLTSYAPNELKYESSSKTERTAVFSEIYYNKGWKAFLDGKEVPHFRANFVLRAMKIPAGNHKIDFKFEPESYYKGESYATMASILTFAVFGFLLFLAYKEEKKEEA